MHTQDKSIKNKLTLKFNGKSHLKSIKLISVILLHHYNWKHFNYLFE